MSEYARCVHEFVLDFRRPTIKRLETVNGDTANTFVITLKDKGKSVTLDQSLHKIIAVFTRADGQIYTQDASTGVTFTTTGIVTVEVYSSSFRTGMNNVKIQLYKRGSSSNTTYPLLLTSYEQTFNGRAAAIPEAGAPNAPSQLPMLEQIIHDAGEAVTNCNTATAAANEAATSANNAASSANSAASAANSAAVDANLAAAEASANADTAREAAADAMMAETAALEAANAANAAATAATTAAAAATEAAKKNLVLVKNNVTWTSDTQASGFTTLSATELRAMMPDSVFAIQIESPNNSESHDVITLFESYREEANNIIYFRTSEAVDKRVYVGAMDIDASGDIKGTVDVDILPDESTLILHVASIRPQSQGDGYVLTFNPGETDLAYEYAFTRDMEFNFEVPPEPDAPEGTRCVVRMRKDSAADDTTNRAINFHGTYTYYSSPKMWTEDYVAQILFNNQTYYGTVIRWTSGSLEGGSVGQVLTRTNNGYEWQTP